MLSINDFRRALTDCVIGCDTSEVCNFYEFCGGHTSGISCSRGQSYIARRSAVGYSNMEVMKNYTPSVHN
jgi:hypothetical protein